MENPLIAIDIEMISVNNRNRSLSANQPTMGSTADTNIDSVLIYDGGKCDNYQDS